MYLFHLGIEPWRDSSFIFIEIKLKLKKKTQKRYENLDLIRYFIVNTRYLFLQKSYLLYNIVLSFKQDTDSFVLCCCFSLFSGLQEWTWVVEQMHF